MLVSKFDFDLPKKVIAQFPTLPREYARLLSYGRVDGAVRDLHFFDLPTLLRAGDVLVMNNSRVMPVRIKMNQFGKGAEVLFIENTENSWKCFVRPGRKFKVGDKICLHELEMSVLSVTSDGFRMIEVNLSTDEMRAFFSKYGEMPVPPYIVGNQYKDEDYNTVYSRREGSVAAPTAGLHFSRQLLYRLISAGIEIEYVTLHVGPGTFLPVKASDSRFHKMHSEKYVLAAQTAKKLNRYVREGRRIIAVGTTSLRVLESNYSHQHGFREGCFSTDIFISPGYDWKVTKGLITNFHLPKSTLLMLVASMIGREKTMELYKKALVSGYRFYSFGDGMIIL